jgi:hypothetical protein
MTWPVRPFPEATIPAPKEAWFWAPSQSWVHHLASNVRADHGRHWTGHGSRHLCKTEVTDWSSIGESPRHPRRCMKLFALSRVEDGEVVYWELQYPAEREATASFASSTVGKEKQIKRCLFLWARLSGQFLAWSWNLLMGLIVPKTTLEKGHNLRESVLLDTFC